MNFFLYEAEDGWRWQIKARNGRIVAESGEAYSTSGNARRAIFKFLKFFWGGNATTIWQHKGDGWHAI